MALGAQAGNVLRMILRQSLIPAAAGLFAGVGVSLSCTHVIAGLLYGVTPTDIGTFAAIALILGVGTLVASYRPARRASKLDPLVALREE